MKPARDSRYKEDRSALTGMLSPEEQFAEATRRLATLLLDRDGLRGIPAVLFIVGGPLLFIVGFGVCLLAAFRWMPAAYDLAAEGATSSPTTMLAPVFLFLFPFVFVIPVALVIGWRRVCSMLQRHIARGTGSVRTRR